VVVVVVASAFAAVGAVAALRDFASSHRPTGPGFNLELGACLIVSNSASVC
jgi:hypothetical protein